MPPKKARSRYRELRARIKRVLSVQNISVAIMFIGMVVAPGFKVWWAQRTPLLEVSKIKTFNLNPPKSAGNSDETTTLPPGIQLSFRGKPLTNYTVSTIWKIKNAGAKPIRPKDFYTPITCNIPSEGELLLFSNIPSSKGPATVAWKETKTGIRLEPVLLNPGDSIWLNVLYQPAEEDPERGLTWNARVTGMPEIRRVDRKETNTIGIFIFGWDIIFLIVLSLILFSVFLYLAGRSKAIKDLSIKPGALILVGSLLSWSAGEVLTTLYGRYGTVSAPVVVIWSVCIIGYVGLISVLWLRGRTRGRAE